MQLKFSLDLHRAVILFVVQAEERNMYDQHILSSALREKYPFFVSYKHELCINNAHSLHNFKNSSKQFSLRNFSYRPSWSYFPQLFDTHHITSVRKTLAQIDQEAELLPDGKLHVFVSCHWKSDFPALYLRHDSFLSVKKSNV